MTLAEAAQKIGKSVVYRDGDTVDQGVITSVSERYVFVRYGNDTASKATEASALTLEEW